MPIRTVLCYGDSNTHGTRPMPGLGQASRFDEADRWPGVLRARLGADWWIIEEGLPGRTTVHDDPIEGRHKNGLATLRASLESHLPLDLVVLMLGTNDLKARFSVTAFDVALSAELLLKEILATQAGRDGKPPKLLLVSPVPVEETGFLGEMFKGGAAKSRQLAPFYEEAAKRQGAAFFDAGSVVQVSPVDGVHFEANQHHRLGAALADVIRGLS